MPFPNLEEPTRSNAYTNTSIIFINLLQYNKPMPKQANKPRTANIHQIKIDF